MVAIVFNIYVVERMAAKCRVQAMNILRVVGAENRRNDKPKYH